MLASGIYGECDRICSFTRINCTGLGIGIIFIVVLLSDSLTLQVQMPLAVLGVLLMEAGVCGMSNKFLPNERRFAGLREEGDRMLDLMRELCSAAVARDRGG